jgi:hypothetical protein
MSTADVQRSLDELEADVRLAKRALAPESLASVPDERTLAGSLQRAQRHLREAMAAACRLMPGAPQVVAGGRDNLCSSCSLDTDECARCLHDR